MDRRDFGQHIATLVLGLSGAAGLDLERLIALLALTEAEPTATRRVGTADVEVIEQLTAEFVRQDYARGSGPIRDAALAQVRAALPLLRAQIAPGLRPRLMLATARLATTAGWASFDVRRHDMARRVWSVGLELARRAEHPLSPDLTVFLLYDLIFQALHLGRPDEALHLSRIGHTVTATQPVSPATTCALANIQAWAHAAQGDAVACDRALGQGLDQFASLDPATTPEWTSYLGEPNLTAYQGVAHYELALANRDPGAAARAVPLLRQAVHGFGPAYARTRARYLPDLVGAHALSGDVGTAVDLGHQAVDEITALSSPRLHDRLRVLDTVLEPMHASPGVAELRQRLATTAA